MDNKIKLVAILAIFGCSQAEKTDNILFNRVEYLESNGLFASDDIEILADGFEWTEGPLWLEEQKKLIFSDIPPNIVYEWSEEEGKKIYLQPSGYTGDSPRAGEKGSNGLLLNNNGQLVLCQHGDRRIAKMLGSLDAPTSEFETIVEAYNGKRLNSPNDAIFDSNGNLYFTDPPYGLEKRMEDPLKEIDFQGVYLLTKSDSLILLTSELTRPNGIALSPDEKFLYVANSDPEQAIWMKYIVNQDGTISGGNVFFDATELVGKEGESGLPDGMKIDSEGNLFATGPGGVWVFNPEGKVIAKVRTGQATSNVAFGPDNKSLYITADDFLMRVKLN